MYCTLHNKRHSFCVKMKHEELHYCMNGQYGIHVVKCISFQVLFHIEWQYKELFFEKLQVWYTVYRAADV